MIPLISYREYIKSATNKVKARKQLRRKILSSKMDPVKAANILKCDARTIKKLISEKNLDYESKKAPINCPHKISKALEEKIIEYRNKTGYGPDMIKLNLTLSQSTSTIYSVLKRNGLIDKQNRRYLDKRKARKIRKKLQAFEKWQLDTKYLTDIPNLVAPIQQQKCPKYEYTLRDIVTGTTFVGLGMTERSVIDSCTFVGLCLYHMRLHGIDTHYVTIQSDNGSEIIGKIDKKRRYHIKDIVEDEFGGSFVQIPPASPRWNSHVESFHGRVQYEFYSRVRFRTINGFRTQLQDFQNNWNISRKALKTKKTPQTIAKEQGYLLPGCFYKFPVLIYDHLHQFLPDPDLHYLPDEVN